MERFFFFTAWPMVPPAPYSCFHLILALSGAAAAFLAALFFSSRSASFRPWRILFACGLFLALTEAYKQGFLYFVVNGRSYDWWYFPFQLCSVPMYLCLAYPFVSPKLQTVLGTFIQDFGLLGGIMALAAPAGLMHPYWTLTLHGFLWHFILIFLGIYCWRSRLSQAGFSGFARTLPLFFICILIATAVNVWTGPEENADMFYISPYYPSLQVVFHSIALYIGIIPGNIVYLFCVCLGAALIHVILQEKVPEAVDKPGVS